MQPYVQTVSGTSLTTTTTLTLVPGLTLNVAAGGVYRFEAFMNWQANATTGVNLVIGVGGSATATSIAYQTAIQTVTDGTSNLKTIAALVSTTIAGASAPTVTATNFAAIITRGLIVVNAAGTFQVQARHTGASSAAVQTGGRFILEQLA
jgi:hypothetical protein